MAVQILLISMVVIVKQIVDNNLWVAQRIYKSDHDKNVYFKSTAAPRDYNFVERPHPSKTAVERSST